MRLNLGTLLLCGVLGLLLIFCTRPIEPRENGDFVSAPQGDVAISLDSRSFAVAPVLSVPSESFSFQESQPQRTRISPRSFKLDSVHFNFNRSPGTRFYYYTGNNAIYAFPINFPIYLLNRVLII